MPSHGAAESVGGGEAVNAPIRYERCPVLPIRFHEYADLFPWLEGEALNALREDIRQHGVREPIVMLDGAILDGRNRYMCARDLDMEYPVREFDGTDPLAFVISHNLHRRHLTESQRASIATRLANMPHGGDRKTGENQSANLPLDLPVTAEPAFVSIRQAAEMLNVSERSVKSAIKVHRDGAPELVAALDAGTVAVSTAADIATLPKDEQVEVVARGEKEILAKAKEIRTAKNVVTRAKRDENLTALSNANSPLPDDRTYPVIYADPPWQYDFSPSSGRAVENHYPTMPIEEILAMPVADLATPDAVLFLWVPPSFIKKGIAVLEAWGFELASSMVWDKEKIGTGIYFRQQHEYLLLGKRGKPITPTPGTQPRSVLRVAREEHSAKPVETYAIIEAMYPGLPKIELFSRTMRDGWFSWGNQANAA